MRRYNNNSSSKKKKEAKPFNAETFDAVGYAITFDFVEKKDRMSLARALHDIWEEQKPTVLTEEQRFRKLLGRTAKRMNAEYGK